MAMLIGSIDLQTLRWWVEQFVGLITQSTKRVPYGIRFLARETLIWLRVSSVLCYCLGRALTHLLGEIPRGR